MTTGEGKTRKVIKVLKLADIPNIRKMFDVKQKYRCAICEAPFGKVTSSVDHCHVNGDVRATLCRGCNRLEGSIRILIRRQVPANHLSKTNEAKFYHRLAHYLRDHSLKPSGLIHPTYDLKKGKQKPKKRVTKKKT